MGKWSRNGKFAIDKLELASCILLGVTVLTFNDFFKIFKGTTQMLPKC